MSGGKRQQAVERADVCVLGGGPAGSAFALRLAQLGHRVWLVERAAFPRPHVGESLTPGVWVFFERLGIAGRVDAAGFLACRHTAVLWSGGVDVRDHTAQPGLLVDRARFDALLLDAARDGGVVVRQPATLVGRVATDDGWRLRLNGSDGVVDLEVAVLADATGRAGALRGERTLCGVPTLALHCDWRGGGLPAEPRIEAVDEGWLWGVPLPGGRYTTMAFVDFNALKGRETAAGRLHRMLAGSALLCGLADRAEAGPVRGCDAGAWVERRVATPTLIKIGEAAIGIDPLSSSGVEKALQSALDAAIVVNTRLRHPGDGAMADAFYQGEVERAALRHRRWAAGFYAAAGRSGHGFWRARAVEPPMEPPHPVPPPLGDGAVLDRPVVPSPLAGIVEVPSIRGDFVVSGPALTHPGLERPAAYLGGHFLPPLFAMVRPGMTVLDLIGRWAARLPPDAGLSVAGWMLGTGLLEWDARRV